MKKIEYKTDKKHYCVDLCFLKMRNQHNAPIRIGSLSCVWDCKYGQKHNTQGKGVIYCSAPIRADELHKGARV